MNITIMKRFFNMLGVLAALCSITTAYAADLNVGISIGTIEAKPYSESGFSLDYFDDVDYVAQTSEDTYMGFWIQTYGWSNDESGKVFYDDSKFASFIAISSTAESVTIPDSIKIEDKAIPVVRFNSSSTLQHGFTENIKNLTIPGTINFIENNCSFDQHLDCIYMLGEAPYIWNPFNVGEIYVCDKANLSSYLKNSNYPNTSIFPYGWELEWITVNVEKNGEFAETYLSQNDYDWSSAQYVKVTGNINYIDLGVMNNLTTLMKLDLSETTITELPVNFMDYRTSLIEIKLPSTLTKIGDSAFYGCSGLQSFNLNGLTEIGSNVFNGCSSLSYIDLSGVTSIGDNAFYNCSKLNNIDLSTVFSIGYRSFENCNSLESIDLSSAISIGNNIWYGRSFYNCTSLKSVVLGDNLQNIYNSSFSKTAIESISLPNSITSIDEDTFYCCSNLASVEIPSSVTTIGERAFYGCTSLQEITIPYAVNNIGASAFDNTGIKFFKCYAAVPPTVSSSFIGTDMDMTTVYLYVPTFSKDSYRNTEYWSNFYLIRSIDDPIDYILIDRPLTINLEKDDDILLSNKPEINLTFEETYDNRGNLNISNVGQLTAAGDGSLSTGKLTITSLMSNRFNHYNYGYSLNCPTIINYADKLDTDNVTHNMTFFDYPDSGEWHFISFPYDVKVSDIIAGEDTHFEIRRYDSVSRADGEDSSAWVNLTNEDILEAGKGYVISAYTSGNNQNGENIKPTLTFSSDNSTTKNNIFCSTDAIVSLNEYESEFAHNASWNLVGNPYPCYFDMNCLNEEFTSPITIWNGSSYVAYSPLDDDFVLSPYEAFFVQKPLDSKELRFKEEGRMHSDDSKHLYKEAVSLNNLPSLEDRNIFNFVISHDKYEDCARIVFNPEAELKYEIGKDASKFFVDNNDNAQIYVYSDVAYSIHERPVCDGVATLGIRSTDKKGYRLALSGKYSDDWCVILTDNETGLSVDLTLWPYDFDSSNNDNTSRFTIKFTTVDNGQDSIDSILSEFGEDINVSVMTSNGVTVYNGRLSEIKVPSSGLYLISNGKITRKVILK